MSHFLSSLFGIPPNKCSLKRDKRVRLSLEVLEDRLTPANFTVNTLVDANVGANGAGTLRWCINQANLAKAATITPQAGLLGVIQLKSSLPPLGGNITIDGKNALTLQGLGANTPFSIISNVGQNDEMDNLTFENGYAKGGGGGGAIFNGGTLTLKNDTFSLNQAAAANGGGGNGGAIYNTKDATLNVSLASVFKINSATNAGGAIYSSGTLNCTAVSIFTNNAANGAGLAIGSGTVNLKNAQIYNDTATQDGGGIYETGGKVTVSGATGGKISGDKASNGGGIFVYSGSLTLKNGVQVFNNEASGGDGGGIFLDTKARASITGGGSVFGNTAMSGNGGGIYNGGGTLTIGGGEQIKGANEAMLGGGIYLAVGSTTTFNTVTVQGNKATLGQGIGIYQQTNNSGQAKVINNGLTDNDDPGGKPFQGP